MTPRWLGKRLAIAGAIVLAALFLAANAHLLMVAVVSQPACLPPAAGHAPAMAGC